MQLDIPEGKDAIQYVWGEMVPGIGVAASKFSMAVYERTTLGLREFEAARLRIAQVNGCLFCLDWRTERERPSLGEAFAELRRICEEEKYTFEIPPRLERPNPFADALDELSV